MTVKTVLFYRHFLFFQGGHLKFFDYINHVNAYDGYTPLLYMAPGSVDHPLWRSSTCLVSDYKPDEADILFLAGDDWQSLEAFPNIEYQKPIINLIQGFRHFSPTSLLFQNLARKATRICVSNELTAKLIACDVCHDRIFTIENGIDHSLLPASSLCDQESVLIIGLKQPNLAKNLCRRLRLHSVNVECTLAPLARSTLLRMMSEVSIVVTLPLPMEGFYLPALEAMAMGKVLICPDCIGNRSFCHHGVNCLMPEIDLDSIEEAVLSLLASPDLARSLKESALSVSQAYNIDRERAQFSQVLMSCGV